MRHLLGALVGLTAAVPGMLTATARAAPSDEGAGVQEIVVTAQRRSENLQSVPIAVSAVTAATAASLGISDPQNVAQLVPGITLNRSSMSVLPFIRGVGSNFGTPGFEPSVAIFVDDIYYPTGAGAVFDFSSISSVEVLKGPQGTLFGRNATGGVIHVHTLDPSFSPAAKIDLGYANYNTYSGQLYASGGLTDKIAVNFAAYGRSQDKGWGKNVLTGADVYTSWGYGARSKLLYDDHDRTTAVFTLSFERNYQDGNGQRAFPGTIGFGGFNPPNAGFYDSFANFPASFTSTSTHASANIKHDFDAFSLVSISGFGRIRTWAPNDSDASPSRFVELVSQHDIKTYTQELQLLSPSDAALHWIAGVYYLHDRSNYDVDNFAGTAFGTSIGTALAKMDTDSISGFGQATAAILPKTNLTIGVRYTSDHRRLKGENSIGATRIGPLHQSDKWSALTGRVAIDHNVTNDVMIYAAYNRGFKSGAFNIGGVSPGQTVLQPSAQPEGLDAYTAGVKSDFWDQRARVNVEAYYYDFTNIQVLQIQPLGSGTIITNGGAATMKGLDVDITTVPIENLTIGFNFAVTYGKYTEFKGGPVFFPLPPNAPIPIPAGCAATVPTYPTGSIVAQRFCDLAGNDTVQTPHFTSSLFATYTIPSEIGTFEVSALWAHSSGYYFEPDNNPQTKQPSTDVVNASLQWSTPNDRYHVRLWAKNLLNEEYLASLTQNGSYYNKFVAAPPRTYGVVFTANFGAL